MATHTSRGQSLIEFAILMALLAAVATRVFPMLQEFSTSVNSVSLVDGGR